jgi:YrbI family 3-deoxy-D-manno-octulosonate 8-phosphate phosphatase
LVLKILVSDIDGVLTDGSVLLDANGGEQKRIFFRDLDALFELHRAGMVLAFVSGESGPWVEMIRGRLPHTYFYAGCKHKGAAVREILELEHETAAQLCYIGDGASDVPAMSEAGIAACPADASPEAISAATLVLKTRGGEGAIAEIASWIRGVQPVLSKETA